MGLELTPRLQTLARRVPPGSRLVDVGTDHAYLPAWLLLHGQIPHAICTDLRPGPLKRAEETVRRYGVEAQTSLRLCDGLADVAADEVDCVVIAGMGGETILSILNAAPWAAGKTCIVQPMSSLVDLRAQIGALGLHIAKETLTREKDALYVVMDLAAGAEGPLTPAEMQVGRVETHAADPLWPAYLEKEAGRLARAIEGLERAKDPKNAPEWRRMCAVLHGIQEMMEGI